ncbi:MAG: UPF0147 family protein [Candidatus Aenigmarchaeota archaeon]|nr:UPF0147 family protein [Candidatus Aenigmarchaeota archaeon]
MDKIEEITSIVEELYQERRIPKNIRAVIEEVLNLLKDSEHSSTVKLSTAVSMLEEASSDPNIPSHLRTEVWNVISILEAAQADE